MMLGTFIINSIFFGIVSIVQEVESTNAETLAVQWAPRIFFHEKEKYFPISVAEFLGNTQCSQLNSQPVPTLPTGPNSYPFYMNTKIDKDILIKDQSSFLHGLNPTRNRVPLYAAITPCSHDNGHVIVTYYAFFGYNEGKEMCSLKIGKMKAGLPIFKIFDTCFGAQKRYFGSHIGDIESMTLEIKNNIPQRLVLSVHNVAVQYKFNGYNLFTLENAEKKGMVQVINPPRSIAVVDGHPVLYSAKGSHAFYGATGDYKYHSLKLPGLSDETAWGDAWDTWNTVEVFFTERAPDWFYYDGKWGNAKSECTDALKNIKLGDEVCTYSDGPRGLLHRELDIKCNQ